VINLNLFLSVVSAVELAYIGAPTPVQSSIHKLVPERVKSHLLFLWSLGDIQLWIFISAVLFAVAGSVGWYFGVRKLQQENAKLKKENLELTEEARSKSINTYEVFSNYLYAFGQKFGLNSTERISLYMLKMNHFSCIGRYSDNETFRAKPRRLYPVTQGSIGRAWQHGVDQVTESPVFAESPDEWIFFHKEKYGFTEEQLSKLTMKSASIFSKRLRNNKHETVGVLVVESMKNTGVPFGKLTKYFQSEEGGSIVNLIEALKSHVPSLEIAESEGF
jgi:hypothetical protein